MHRARFFPLILVLGGLCAGAALVARWGQAQAPRASQAPDEPIPRTPPLEPDQAAESFRVRNGFSLDLLAHEPLVTDPVAMEYDENGLAYVVEMRDYPYTDKSTDQPNVERLTDLPLGRVRVLEDVDGDGKFDRSEIFAEDLSWPTGVVCWKGGIYVSATPDVWYLRDTDGDHRADERRKVFTGFRKYNVQAVMNNLKWGFDHQIYGAGATNGGTISHLARPEHAPAKLAQNDFRFRPQEEILEPISGGARFGNTFDDWGNRFVCNIRNPAQQVVLESRYLARNPNLPVATPIHDAAPSGDTLPVFRISPVEPWRAVRALRLAADTSKKTPRSESNAAGFVTSSSGITVYRGSAYPEEYRGNLFLGEVANNLIHRQTLTPQGVAFVAARADENVEFAASTDIWFRPVNFVNAPDGTLHVLDMYRETIEHPWSIPDDIKAQLDLESGRDRGRIYRLSPPGFQVPPRPHLGQASTPELVACLENPNGWWRDTAHRLLYERQDKQAAPGLRELLLKSSFPQARLHALWSLEGLGELADDDLLAAFRDPSAHLREHAIKLAEGRWNEALLAGVLKLANDPEIRVRFQAAFSLGEVNDGRTLAALAEIYKRDSQDPWARVAVLSSASNRTLELLGLLLDDVEFTSREECAPCLRQLSEVLGTGASDQDLHKAWKFLQQAEISETGHPWPWDVVGGLGEGLRRRGRSIASSLPEDGQSARILERFVARALEIATHESLDAAARVHAVAFLAFGPFEQVASTLSALLDPRQPREVQLSAVRTISRFAEPAVMETLLAAWVGASPAVRAELLEAMLARPERLDQFLDAVAAQRIAAGQVDLVRRRALLAHVDERIRARANSLLGLEAPGKRAQVVAEYQSALKLDANFERGRAVFQRDCKGCHRLDNVGSQVGPNLATIRNRTPHELLVQILDPNREVSPDFLQYIISTQDGLIATGLIASETATSVTIRRAENIEETILRANIDQMQATGLSLMPEGLEQKLTPQEMADLLAFLLATNRGTP